MFVPSGKIHASPQHFYSSQSRPVRPRLCLTMGNGNRLQLCFSVAGSLSANGNFLVVHLSWAHTGCAHAASVFFTLESSGRGEKNSFNWVGRVVLKWRSKAQEAVEARTLRWESCAAFRHALLGADIRRPTNIIL